MRVEKLLLLNVLAMLLFFFSFLLSFIAFFFSSIIKSKDYFIYFAILYLNCWLIFICILFLTLLLPFFRYMRTINKKCLTNESKIKHGNIAQGLWILWKFIWISKIKQNLLYLYITFAVEKPINIMCMNICNGIQPTWM